MKTYDIENIGIYLYVAEYCIWLTFCLLSSLSIAESGLLVTLAGPLFIILTRLVLILAEHRRLKTVVLSQQYEMYTRTYHYNNNTLDDNTSPELPEDHHQTAVGGGGGGGVKLNSSVFLQVDVWELSLAIAVATALIIVGVRHVTTQKWALWMGLAILTELVMRLVLEILRRKTDIGLLVPRWLARQAWWRIEYVAELMYSEPF